MKIQHFLVAALGLALCAFPARAGEINSGPFPGIGATLSASPSNPANTTSTTGVMAGVGGACKVKPSFSSRALVTFTGILSNSTSGDGAQVTGRYGTGAAPANAAATSGTQFGAPVNGVMAAINQNLPFAVSDVLTGLTPGTTYWLDLQQQTITGGTASLFNVHCVAVEF